MVSGLSQMGILGGTEVEDEQAPRGNILKLWGNPQTMNLNTMIYTNIVQSPYFKANLVELKTYHEVIDEIYYKVEHLEPWERGSRRIGGQTGMCGGVRGVGAGGIVSTAYCLLYKLFTLKLTRKQLKGLLDHPDSPYIRALGFMYIRYCIPPEDFWWWYSPYWSDPEELDVKAGGGCIMTIGNMLEHWLTKLDWFSTLFPRIPVPVQKKLEEKMRVRKCQALLEVGSAQEKEGKRSSDRNRDGSYHRSDLIVRNTNIILGGLDHVIVVRKLQVDEKVHSNAI
ncbi:Pre-mRNA-splicing factor 38B [Schistosoma japonicum]|uniref:Pre-mRNA-splicing factor 38 n=1 Tax=Schistosoma japonicum TaxID=6182 RepID=C1LKB2_SCHJA|nr:Pre-mRNA-splicing factor 38B [Schistosoma japonicum]CAX75139.1 Pre-mRNA-splicing factor 38B [Schistosoma japonicum]CAX75140.1 Pre-mRNA-splicing factor 38B [Schistosoma japonicum]